MTEIDRILTAEIKKNRTPSVHYVHFDRNRIVHRFKAGFADIKNNRRISDTTSYHAFSVTKTFTALAVLKLAEKKKLSLDESVKKHLPSFPYGIDITSRHLLNHTAGIPSPIPLSWVHLEVEHAAFDRNRFFNKVFAKHGKAKSGPNERFAYSDLGYILLGQLIEEVSGESYVSYVRENILKPLGLDPKELGFEIVHDANLAKGYQKNRSIMNLLLGFFIDKSKFMAKTEGLWKPFRDFYVNGAPDGGLTGTPNAFVIYTQELLKPGCKLLTDEFKKILFTENYTREYKPTGMCLSWFAGNLSNKQYFAHEGVGGGYYCEVRIYPEIGIGSLIMLNRSGMRDERFLDKLDVHFIKKNNDSF